MSTGEVACSYAAMILHDDSIPITPEKIATLLKSANVDVESYWPHLFAKLTEKDVEELTMAAPVGSAPDSVAMVAPAAAAAASGAAPAVEEKNEESEEGSDDDMPLFDLFE